MEERHAPLKQLAMHVGQEKTAYALAVGVLATTRPPRLPPRPGTNRAGGPCRLRPLKESLPATVCDHVEMLNALGWRAIQSGDVSNGRRLARKGLDQCPIPLDASQLGTMIVQVEKPSRSAGIARARKRAPTRGGSWLLESHPTRFSEQEMAGSVTRARGVRPNGATRGRRDDFRAAIEAVPTDPHFPFSICDVSRKTRTTRFGHRDSPTEYQVADEPMNRVQLATLLAAERSWDRAAGVAFTERASVPTAVGDTPDAGRGRGDAL